MKSGHAGALRLCVVLALSIAGGMALPGCGKPVPVVQGAGPFEARSPARGVPEVVTPTSAGPRISFAQEQHARLASMEREPLMLALDEVSVVPTPPSMDAIRGRRAGHQSQGEETALDVRRGG